MEQEIKFSKKQSALVWIGWLAAFAGFIALYSYLYPLTADDVIKVQTPLQVLRDFFYYALDFNPKTGSLISLSFIYLGKPFFILVNSIIQPALAFLIFFVIFGHKPDFKAVKDFPSFALICLLLVFGVTAPDNTLFWIVGACTYSWTMVLFFGVLALLRAALDGKITAKHSLYFYAALAALGIATGMMNENNGPMALILCCLFFAWQKYKKAKIQPWFYVLAAGIAAGVALLFLAPGSYKRLAAPFLLYFHNASLTEKIFWNLSYQQDMLAAALYLPAIAAVANIVALFDDKRDFKNRDLAFSFLALGTSLTLCAALALAPQPPQRAFYSASLFGWLAFIFTVKYWGKIYKVNLLKFAFILIAAYCIFILPLFALPYFNLHEQEVNRNFLIEQAKAQGKTDIPLPKYMVLRGPTKNLTITFYDVLLASDEYIKKNLSFTYVRTAQQKAENVGNISTVL